MENKKIKNATPTEYNNINFRSKLEARIAKYMTEHDVKYSYEKVKLTLLSTKKYEGTTYRAVTYTPDFIVKDYIIEVKGFPNDTWALKKKLIIDLISRGEINYHFREVHNLRELKQVLFEIHGKAFT